MNFLFGLRNPHNKGILALILANIIWGAAAPIFKLALMDISPFTLAFLRFFGASLLLYPFIIGKAGIHKKDIPAFIAASLCGITFNISLFFLGLRLAPSINAPIIASSGPIILAVGSVLFLKEKLKSQMIAGFLISLVGIALIVGEPILNTGLDGALAGNLLFFFATISHVGYTIISKRFLSSYPTLTTTYWLFLIGAITFLPLFLYESVTLNPLFSLDIRGITGIVFGIFLSSAAAYLLYEWGLKRIPSHEVGLFFYLDPIVAAIIAIPLLGESITSILLIGSVLVFAGIAVAEGRLHYHPFHKLR